MVYAIYFYTESSSCLALVPPLMASNVAIPVHKNLNHLVYISITTRSESRKLDQLENLLIGPFVSSVSKQRAKVYESYVSKTDALKVKGNATESHTNFRVDLIAAAGVIYHSSCRYEPSRCVIRRVGPSPHGVHSLSAKQTGAARLKEMA